MTFDEVLEQVRELLQSKGRVTYRALKRRFDLDDEYLEDLKSELIKAERVAVDEDGEVLVWVGKGINGESKGEKAKGGKGETEVVSSQLPVVSPQPPAPSPQSLAERRQLTVMFCDLVDSTALSAQLDPEELREVIRQYQETCTTVIRRYEGYIAQHLGDGLLVYFGYPVAHEDDAARAVRAGLEIITALQLLSSRPQVPSPFQGEGQGEGRSEALPTGTKELHVRIGIHTGLVVIGEIGSSEKREMLALGETPNIAARLQGHANPDEVVISTVTQRLVLGLFDCQELGPQTLKGVAAPMVLYRAVRETGAQSRFEAAVRTGLTPLVGREEELALLRRRWERAKEGEGQVVLLSGEAGIGKSRLVQEIKGQVSAEGAIRIEFRCSPYHQNSAYYPILDHLQHLLQFAHDDPPQVKLAKLEQALTYFRFPQADTLPLLAALLSLPHPDNYPPITVSPQKQKEKTQEALVAWMIEEATRQAVYLVWEDLHWIDPSSLEVLTLILQQVPTNRALVVLTYRPDFTPPWRPRAHSTLLTLSRLGQQHVTAMVNQVTVKAVLSDEVIRQIVSRTDGVPLFIEELTKSVAESVGASGRASLPSSAIPTTLHDSLMSRLDRLGAAKTIAQLGATLGREFNYELLQAVAPVDTTALQHSLQQLVDAELLYQRGLPPQATYLFKHALIQDTAYQSLLKSTRQQYHQQIAQKLEAQFPETKETQTELLAHHYTEAGLTEQAISYWHQAGQKASQSSANSEAISHLTKGLELLKALSDTPERVQQELTLQIALAMPLIATKGYATPEVENTWIRALELCRQLGETAPQLLLVLLGLSGVRIAQAEHQTAHELAEQCLSLALRAHDSLFIVLAHHQTGTASFYLGEVTVAQAHMEQGIALYDSQKHNPIVSGTAYDLRVGCLCYAVWALWSLGYPDQALKKLHEALTLAQELAHPISLAFIFYLAVCFHQCRREGQAVQERLETLIALSNEQGFVRYLALGTLWQGWVLAEQGQYEEGIAQIYQGLTAYRATGSELLRPYYLTLLVETYRNIGQVEEGLAVLAEALALVDKTGERFYEAELYRLKGELTRAQSRVQCPVSSVQKEAEECFLKAIEIAQKQQAKSLELRAAMSLARLWQRQGKRTKAHKLLSGVYNWFTEGFDTKDLQEAKELLDRLRSGV